MSALLRSVRIVRSLKNLSEKSVSSGALKPYSINIATRNFPIHNARFFGIQHASVRRADRPGTGNELNNMLERLNTEGRQFGRISFNLFQDVVSQLQDCNSVSSSQALVVLRCCGALMPEQLPEARVKLAHNIWQILLSREFSLDLSHYNALLRVYVENEHDFAPSEFLERLQQKNIAPNRVTYQRLISRYAQLGDIEGATKILETMKEQNLPINEGIFLALILGHSRAGDLKNAEEMLAVMQESGLEPSVDAYLALAVAQAERGHISGVKSTIALSAEKEEALHDRDLAEVIYALASKGHSDHVPEIIDLLKKEYGYNQDCKNLIYRLLNAGCDDTARLIYSTMDSITNAQSESSLNQGLFYVKHLIARDKPLSSILSLCEDVSGDSAHLLQRSLEAAFTQNPKLAYPLMDAIQAKGADLRPHFFWPLIARCAKDGDYDGVYEVLNNMRTRDVTITMYTMLDYVLPAVLRDPTTQIDDVIDKLTNVGLPVPDVCTSMARFLVQQNDLPSAVQMLQQYSFRIAPNVRRDLAMATIRTKDYWNAAAILSALRVGRQPDLRPQEGDDAAESLPGEDQSNDGAVALDREDVVGRFLLDISQRTGSAAGHFDWLALLSAVKDRGLSMSKELEATVSHALGRQATPEVNELLSVLASGTLSKVRLQRQPTQFLHYSKMSAEELEAALERCTSQGRDPKQILHNLLVAYADAKEVEKAEHVLKTLEETHQYPLGVGLRVVLINMYIAADQPQPAFDMLEKIREAEPDVVLSSKVVLRLANLYVNAGKIEDAAVFLETEGKKRQESGEDTYTQEGNDYHTGLICNQILAPSADSGDAEMVSRLQRAILGGRFAAPSRRLFNPTVRAHLAKGDVESAFAAVVECKKNYNMIPYRKGLSKELIRREDTNKLQQLVDMATDLYGEHESLFELATYFIDEDRLKEAKRILETPGLRVRGEVISSACKFYLKEKQTKSIEDLLSASVEVTSIDRRVIYQHLLEAYIDEGNSDKALGLWTQMQEEDLPITDEFLRGLGIFLQQNDKPVPFAIPAEVAVPAPPPVQARPRQDIQKQRTRAPAVVMVQASHPKLLEYQKLLKDEKLDEALSLHNELLNAGDKELSVNLRDSTTLAGKLFDAGRLHDTAHVIQTSRSSRGRGSLGYVLMRKTASRLADLGDYDSVENLVGNDRFQGRGEYLPFYMCKVAAQSNQCERYLNKVEKMLDEISSHDVAKLSSRKFSSSGMMWLLKKDPALLTRLENLSGKMKSKGVMEGVKTLWAYHFIQGNTQEAEKLSEELKESGDLSSHIPVLHHCRDSEDVQMAENFLSYLKANPLHNSDDAIATTYNCIIDILCVKNNPKEALKVLEESLKSIKLESIKVPSLNTLSELLAAENIEFPFKPAAKQQG